MSSALAVIQEIAPQLSPQQQVAVVKFMETLLHENKLPTARGLTFDWCDQLQDPPVPYSSVELQHLASVWRIEDELQRLGWGEELTFDWADGPDAEPEPLTSVELQHQAARWWVEEEMKRS